MEHINDIRRRAFNRPALAVIRQPEENDGDWEEEGLINDDCEDELDDASVVEGTVVEQMVERQSQESLTMEISVKAAVRVIPPKSVCPLCKGAGYLRQDVPYGHPQFAKPKECRCHKEARKEREQQRLQKLSQLDTLARFEDASFDEYDATVPGVQQAYQAAFKFAMRPKGWLALVGPNGCGKTHLAVATAKERVEANDTVMIQTVPDLLDYLRSGFSSSSTSSYEILFDQMRRVDLLVLDDLGSQHNSPWAMEKIFQILNYRYNMMLPTLITANYLRDVDPRVASRLSDRGLVTMVIMDRAGDYRPRNIPVEEDE
jgi:DNA replication protein DnaC